MLINLLPHREWALARKRQEFAISMGLAVMVGVLIAVCTSAWLARQLEVQRAGNSKLRQAIFAVDLQLKLKAQVIAELGQLNLREKTLRDMRDESQLAGIFLQELAAHLPDGLYLMAMKQDGEKVHINGFSRSDEEVFELLRHMVNSGQWLARPELIEVASAPVAPLIHGVPAGAPFSMRAWLTRPKLPAENGAQLHSSVLD